MPSIDIGKVFGKNGGKRIYLRLQAGVTSGPLPQETEEKRDRQLRAAWKKLRSQKGKKSGAGVAGLQQGSLPDFLIIGAQKAGTTLLYSLLMRHPLVKPPVKKELHFFDSKAFHTKGVRGYMRQFPPKKEDTITGEASPYYLFHPLAAKRAAEVVPQAKLIVMLRNPVDRAYSDYRHRVADSIEDLGFEQALEAEEGRLAGEAERMLADARYVSRNHRCYGYLSRGIYADQIMEWHRHFDPQQMLILKSEDVFADPVGHLHEVQRFLGLPPHTPQTDATRKVNSGFYDPLEPGMRERLREYFAPHNERLYEYLGRDFGW